MIFVVYNLEVYIKYHYFLCFKDDKFASEICQLRMKPDDFNLIKVIGRGAFGEVQLVSNRINHLVVDLFDNNNS